jgi:uncharacterized protein YjbJ (UPF0337 family)
MDNKDQAKGKLKQAVGDLTDNKKLQGEGKADEKAGDAKKLIDKVGDKAHDLVDSAKKALHKD